jgi:hypothetical protein
MNSDKSNGRCGFRALCAVLAMGLALAAEAAPFAYIVNSGDGTASV